MLFNLMAVQTDPPLAATPNHAQVLWAPAPTGSSLSGT
jgi:hypothetical protein